MSALDEAGDNDAGFSAFLKKKKLDQNLETEVSDFIIL